MAAIMARERTVQAGRAARARVGRTLAAVVAALGLMGIGATIATRSTPAATSEVLVGVSNLTYSTQALRVVAGEVTLAFANTDAIPHTFTIRELDVALEAGGGEAARATFTAAPGTYDFICTIPGHDTPGMRGVLTVTD